VVICCEGGDEILGFIKCGEDMKAFEEGLCYMTFVVQATEIPATCF
jgi:hypothetical protein